MTKNRNNNYKPIQFYVPKNLKMLREKISNSKIIEHTEFNNMSDYLREAFKIFTYYLLIKENKEYLIPEYDRLIAYKISK